MTANTRIGSIDFIKGVCIFLVVWGHSIQNMGGDTFWENPVHEFICSFHMPIFMMVSGFFFCNVIDKSLLQSMKKKFMQLMVPCFGWSVVLVLILTGYLVVDQLPVSLTGQIKTLFYETFTRFWFLRSVFICYTLGMVSMRVFRNNVTACVLSILLFLLLPDNGRIHLDKFMYPFFWMGYFLHKHIDWILRHRTKILLTSFILFVALLLNWEKEHYIYITSMSLYEWNDGHLYFHDFAERLSVVLYRYLIGLAGSLLIFLLLQRVYRPQYTMITQVGTYTLGIYTIHILIEGNILRHLSLADTGFFWFNFVITPVISLLLIGLCIGMIRLLEKNKYSSLLFLGKPKIDKHQKHKSENL